MLTSLSVLVLVLVLREVFLKIQYAFGGFRLVHFPGSFVENAFFGRQMREENSCVNFERLSKNISFETKPSSVFRKGFKNPFKSPETFLQKPSNS